GTMTDGPGVPYVGDRWRRGDGRIDRSGESWDPTNPSARAALHAADLLGYGSSPPTVPSGTQFATDWTNFRDPLWEQYGYDLDVARYRASRGSGPPLDPSAYLASNGGSAENILVPAGDRYQGFSMGPGYWGKSFYIWPPDPRAPVGNPGESGYQAGDWRRRYFYNTSGGALNTQGDNNTGTTGTNASDGINEALFTTSGQTLTLTASQV